MSDHLMVIRHAEKPNTRADGIAVDAAGRPCDAGLSVRGWQRAGALVALFTRGRTDGDARLVTPVALFAAADKPGSRRPALTVQPVAHALGLPLCTGYQSGQDELCLLRDLEGVEGPVLVCWRHDAIPRLAQALVGDAAPSRWDDACYDEVWVLTRGAAGAWRLDRVRQSLLAGDERAAAMRRLRPAASK